MTQGIVAQVAPAWRRNYEVRGNGRRALPVADARRKFLGRTGRIEDLTAQAEQKAALHCVEIDIRTRHGDGLITVRPDTVTLLDGSIRDNSQEQLRPARA